MKLDAIKKKKIFELSYNQINLLISIIPQLQIHIVDQVYHVMINYQITYSIGYILSFV